MNNYITKQDAINAMYEQFPLLQKDTVRKAIERLPETIIHCENCKWWSDKRMTVGRLCTVTERYTDGEFFCKAGRRKDG